MGLTPEEVAELAQLKQLVQQLPDDPVQPEAPGFIAGLQGQGSGKTELGTWAGRVGQGFSNAWSGVNKIADAMNPEMGIAAPIIATGQVAYDGVKSPVEAVDRTGQLLAGLVPGGQTGYQATKDYFNDNLKSSYEYGQMAGQDIANYAPTVLTAGLGNFGARIIGNRGAQVAGEAAALSDEASQAAIRYGQNRGLYSPQMEADLAAGKVTPKISDAARVAQSEAINSKIPDSPQFPDASPGQDYAPGIAAGLPESSASTRPFAASEEMGRAGNTLVRSGIYNGGERINPFTGKFEGPPSAPLNDAALMQKAEQAAVDTIVARKNTVELLDAAHTELAKQGPTISRITWKDSIAPMLKDLEGVVRTRRELAQSVPISQEMMTAYQKIRESFDNMNRSEVFKVTPDEGLASLGLPNHGDVTLSQTLGLIESMNAFRKALGEFDEAGKAGRLNATFSDITGRQAELYSMSQVQKVAQSALESKAAEILNEVPNIKSPALMVRGQPVPVEALTPIQSNSLGIMNETYGAMQTYKEALLTRQNTTRRGMVTPEGQRQITATKDAAQSAAQLGAEVATKGPVRTFLGKMVGGKGEPPNLPLQDAERNMLRPTSAVSQVLDTLLLRDRPVPLISRSWENAKLDPAQIAAINNATVAIGLLPPGVFETLSDPIKREVHKQLTTAAPQVMQAAPGGLDIHDGTFSNIFEQEAHYKAARNLPLDQQARIMSAAYDGNKYIPLPGQDQTSSQVASPQVSLDQLNQRLAPALAPNTAPAYDLSYDNSLSSMLDQLTNAKAIHGLN